MTMTVLVVMTMIKKHLQCISLIYMYQLTYSHNNFLQYVLLLFPRGSDGKKSTCNVGDLGPIPGLGRSPGGGHGNRLQYSCLENPYGQRSLAGYSPRGHEESDTTE